MARQAFRAEDTPAELIAALAAESDFEKLRDDIMLCIVDSIGDVILYIPSRQGA